MSQDIREELAAELSIAHEIGPTEAASITHGVVRRARAKIEREMVTIDTTEVDPDSTDLLQLRVDEDMTISRFLDLVYFDIAGLVKPFSYEREWLLVDKHSGEALTDVGRDYARAHLDSGTDYRPATSVGVLPGTAFEVVRPGTRAIYSMVEIDSMVEMDDRSA